MTDRKAKVVYRPQGGRPARGETAYGAPQGEGAIEGAEHAEGAEGEGETRTGRRRGQRLALAERLRILALHKLDPSLSARAIGRKLGVSHEAVRLTITAAGEGAADILTAYSGAMLDHWIRAASVAASRGDHRPAREWLLHSGAVQPLPDTRSQAPSIVIVNAPLPGMPNAAIDIRARTVIED